MTTGKKSVTSIQNISKYDKVSYGKETTDASKHLDDEELEREANYRHLLEINDVIPWEADVAAEQFTYIGRQVVGLMGFARNRWYEKNFWNDHIYPKDRNKTVRKFRKSCETMDDFSFDYRMVNESGGVVWFHNICNVTRKEGEPISLRGFLINITESILIGSKLRAAYKEMDHLKDRLEILCENAPVGLCYLGADLRFLHVNNCLAELNGVSAQEHIGKHLLEILPDATSVKELLEKVVKTGTPVSLDKVEVTNAKGNKTIRAVSYSPDIDSNGEVVGVRCAIKDITDLHNLELENKALRKEIEVNKSGKEMQGQSTEIKEVLSLIDQVAPTDTTVLLTGETGTGKELAAREIHNCSSRASRSMIVVNCAALPATLIESELFGREKGAFTGALAKQGGRFEVADGSTLFLDEIGELPLELQPKLLRVLQEGEFERLGGTQTIKVDVRIIAATNRNLLELVRKGEFRGDLYYRLSSFPITIPPLRDRAADIPELVWLFVNEFEKKMGKRIDSIDPVFMDQLQTNHWPGNVRELHNVVERAMILTQGRVLRGKLLDVENIDYGGHSKNLDDVERNHILNILAETKWRVRGDNGAANILGLKPSTLESRMNKLGIRRPQV